MIRTTRLFALLLLLVLLLETPVACSDPAASMAASVSASSGTETSAESMAASVSDPSGTETSAESMAASVSDPSGTETWEWTDSLGRTVRLPRTIERIALSGPLTQIYVFPLCHDRLVGFSTAFSEDAARYLPASCRDLPELGQLHGGRGTLNLEALLAARPDLVLDVGEAKASLSGELDALSAQTGIPFVHIDATVFTAPEAYRTLGQLLQCPEKAEELAVWCEQTLSVVDRIMQRVDQDGVRRRVLYCLGPEGHHVLARGSYHAQILEKVAVNAAAIEAPVSDGDGNEVGMEQLLLWDPDVLLFQHGSIYEEIKSALSVSTTTPWEQMSSVRSGQYYQIPSGPYGWISSPPSVQCYLGLLWLTDRLYPDYADFDLKHEVQNYYRLFYEYELSDEEYAALNPA